MGQNLVPIPLMAAYNLSQHCTKYPTKFIHHHVSIGVIHKGPCRHLIVYRASGTSSLKIGPLIAKNLQRGSVPYNTVFG